MKIVKEYEATNDNGLYKCKEQSNGVIIKSLVKPSKKYLAKMKASADAFEIKQVEIKKEEDLQRVITERIREIAIKELKEENIIDKDGKLVE